MKKLRVEHIPQLPCTPFFVDVRDLHEAKLIMDTLANYDLFLYDNNHRVDYANCTYLCQFNEDSQEWESWEDENTGITDLDEYHLTHERLI